MQKKPRIYYIETQHNLPNSYGEGTNRGGGASAGIYCLIIFGLQIKPRAAGDTKRGLQ